MKNAMLFLLLTVTSVAWGQDIKHAPTAEQCKADMAVWKPQSKADTISLPVRTLLQRSIELYDCNRVLGDVQDRDGVEWALTMRGVYEQHISSRAMKFIDRNGLTHQFYDEDAKGAR